MERLERAVAAIVEHLAPYMNVEQADERARNIVQAIVGFEGESIITDIDRMLEPIDEFQPGIVFAQPRYRVAVECFRSWIETQREPF